MFWAVIFFVIVALLVLECLLRAWLRHTSLLYPQGHSAWLTTMEQFSTCTPADARLFADKQQEGLVELAIKHEQRERGSKTFRMFMPTEYLELNQYSVWYVRCFRML
jgi:hypothetical protein